MTLIYECGNQEALIGYLYYECEPAERAAVAAHLAICPHCAAEAEAFRATRGSLAAWTPPEAQLGFRIVSDAVPDHVIRPARWWRQPLPAWAQAAAAVLIFGVGAGLGALRGSAGNATPATAALSVTAPAGPAAISAQDLSALEARLRSEMQQLRPVAATTSHETAAPVAGPSLDQVRALIAESEQRQQRELAVRTAEVIRDFDTQRRGDLARIEQTFGRMEGTTGAQVEQQRQLLNYLMRVSQRQPQ